MNRVNLLLTDQSSSGSKMATTGFSTPSGSTRTKAAKGLFSHFFFLASLLLISLLTSGKVSAEPTTYTVTLADAENCKLEITEGTPITAGTGESRTIVIAVVSESQTTHKLPGTVTIDMSGNVTDFTYTNGTITLGNTLNITGDLTITAAAVEKSHDATLSALQYQLGSGENKDVTGFDSGTNSYTLADLDFTKETTVTLQGTPATGASITTNAAANITTAAEGTQSATATIVVTAEDGTTTQTYTVNFAFKKDELTGITAPSITVLDAKAADVNVALEALNAKNLTAAITTGSGAENDPLAVVWTYDQAKNQGSEVLRHFRGSNYTQKADGQRALKHFQVRLNEIHYP